jgi:hypothetical protein
MASRIIYALFLLILWVPGFAAPAESGTLYLQVVKPPEDSVLLEFQVEDGDLFYIDYVHSSDHTPVHDVFRVRQDTIVLTEERFDWYGSGLESLSHDGARVVLEGGVTRVFLNRKCPRLLLRVGRVAGHVITCQGKSHPLLSVAEGGDQVWIRLVRKSGGR